jgi:hypothetical protein
MNAHIKEAAITGSVNVSKAGRVMIAPQRYVLAVVAETGFVKMVSAHAFLSSRRMTVVRESALMTVILMDIAQKVFATARMVIPDHPVSS